MFTDVHSVMVRCIQHGHITAMIANDVGSVTAAGVYIINNSMKPIRHVVSHGGYCHVVFVYGFLIDGLNVLLLSLYAFVDAAYMSTFDGRIVDADIKVMQSILATKITVVEHHRF